MKLVSFTTILVLIVSLLISCSESEDDLPKEIKSGILLEINPEFNCYVDENGNHYYSNIFKSKNDTSVYRLKVESGINYHIYSSQSTVQSSHIEMILFNQEMDTITWSSLHQDGHRILYQSNQSGEVYLQVFIKGPITESLAYDLYFEAIQSNSLSFAGYNWESTGLWEKESENTIKFHCNNTLKYRWIRLNEEFQDSPDISFTVKSLDKIEFNSLGFVIAGSQSMLNWGDYQHELPNDGYFFNMMNEQQFAVFDMQGDGISFSYGELNIPDLDLQEGINFRISYSTDSHSPHYVVSVNNVFVKAFSTTYVQKFYLVVEDNGKGEIVFANFNVEPMK